MEIKNRIRAKALELFINNSIKNTAMDEIALSLGISKRTIYENFKDKEDILLQCLSCFNQEKQTQWEEAEKNSNNVLDVFLKMLDNASLTMSPNIKFFEDIDKYYPKIKKLMLQKSEQNFEDSKLWLKKGIEEGVIRANLNIEAAAYIIYDTHSYLFTRALQPNKHSFSIRELMTTILFNFLRGISTQKGIEIIDKYLEENPFKQ